MLFSAGVGVGLFFYGVSEPLWHQSSNYYANAGYHTQDEVDQWALEITMYHWGFAAWSPYLIMALATGLASFCFDLPLTVRSCFYPIFGEYVWGWLGDLLDSWSIVMTVAGICTSLGLGTMQLTAGLQRLGWVDPEKEDLSATYVIIVWVITLFATISVVTGLKVGIKTLSLFGFILGCLILFLCFSK
jgi:choline-glycine betaine transporter